MKSAFLLSPDLSLYEHIRDMMANIGVDPTADKVIQIREPDGRLFTLESDLGSYFDYELNEPIKAWRGVGEAPDITKATGCYVECRWEDVFIKWVEYIADRLPYPLWVLDSDGILWPAHNIDPTQLAL